MQGHHRSSKSGEQMRTIQKQHIGKLRQSFYGSNTVLQSAVWTPEIIRGIALPALKKDAECLRSLRPKAAQTATLTAQRPWLRHAPHSLMSHDVLSRALKQCRRLPAVLAQSFRCVCSFLLWLEKNNQTD